MEWCGYLEKFILKYEEKYYGTLENKKGSDSVGVLEFVTDDDNANAAAINDKTSD